jgi:hypothetical protein
MPGFGKSCVQQNAVTVSAKRGAANEKARGGARLCSGRLGFAKPSNKEERMRNAGRRQSSLCRAAGTAAHPAGCARLSAFHRGSCQRDYSSQRLSFRPGFSGRGRFTLFAGRCYRPCLSRLQRGTSHAGHSAGRLMPKAARGEVASRSAGTALAPMARYAAEPRPSHERGLSRS